MALSRLRPPPPFPPPKLKLTMNTPPPDEPPPPLPPNHGAAVLARPFEARLEPVEPPAIMPPRPMESHVQPPALAQSYPQQRLPSREASPVARREIKPKALSNSSSASTIAPREMKALSNASVASIGATSRGAPSGKPSNATVLRPSVTSSKGDLGVPSATTPPTAAPAPPQLTPKGENLKSSPLISTGNLAPAATTHRRIRRRDLDAIGTLGVGAFGHVTLVQDQRTRSTYALKAVSKGYLMRLQMEKSVLNEKRILKMVNSPFVVKLVTTYNGREHVYFLLEAALGGELFTTYEKYRLYGSHEHARFYLGCVIEAFDHLHSFDVIYRDLKPENLLLDARGYCKITDMGLAKITKVPTFSLVGTPDYMAPEVIKRAGHNKSVDFWMLGILLYELLAGNAPFEGGESLEIYERIKGGIEKVRFPSAAGPVAEALVRALCKDVPEKRLMTPKLRSDEWFSGFSWSNLRSWRIVPPLIPEVKGPADLSNFRDCEGERAPEKPYEDPGTGWDWGFEDDDEIGMDEHPAPVKVLATRVTVAPPKRAPPSAPSGAYGSFGAAKRNPQLGGC